ncbi:MAG: cysteine ABC transporter substrate-binding protein [Atopobiaceae bacterium]|nr:cysteine ABC transporter substrate-binding protein [Atopobiaceae bacterium]
MSSLSRRSFVKSFGASFAMFAGMGLVACGGSDNATNDDSSASSGAGYRTLEDIQADGKVIIGVFSDKAPFGYVDDAGTYQGYDVEFANRLVQDLGTEVEWVATDPANRVPFLESNKVDIILANFTVTEERAEKVDFSLPYMKVQLGVVSPDSALVKSVDDLKDKKLIVVKGTTAETFFEAEYPDIELQKYDQYADAYNALLDGRGDAFSTDNTEVLAWAKENPGFTVGIDALGNEDTIAAAVAKGNDSLLNFIDNEIEALADEEFFHKDYEKTLAPVYGTDVDADTLVVEGGKI